MARLPIAQYVELKNAGYTDAEIVEYSATLEPANPAPAEPANQAPAEPANQAPVEPTNQAPAEPANQPPAENETQKLLRQMLGLLQRQNIRNNEMPTDPESDPAETMGAILNPRPRAKK